VQPPPLIALEIVIGFVAPIGVAVWELWSLRREQRRDLEKARSPVPQSDLPAGETSDVGPP